MQSVIRVLKGFLRIGSHVIVVLKGFQRIGLYVNGVYGVFF